MSLQGLYVPKKAYFGAKMAVFRTRLHHVFIYEAQTVNTYIFQF